MADTIEGYLAELKGALAGADPALTQDALYDAEEYLRSAASDGGDTSEAIAAGIEAYGTPAEVAAAYLETERTVAAALRRPAPPKARSALGRFFGVVADPGAWGALLYMLFSLLTGVVYFTAVVTGLSLSLGLMILIIGIPMALLFLATVRAISLAEGRVVEGLLGVRMPRRPRTIGTSGGFFQRIKSWLADYRTWTTMLYMVLQLPLGVAYFTIAVTGLATSVAVFGAPIAQLVFNIPIARSWDYVYYLQPWAMPLMMAAGFLGFFVTLWLAKGIGYLHGMFAKVMLVGRFERDDQPALAASSAAAPTAAAAPAIATALPATTPPVASAGEPGTGTDEGGDA